MIIECKCYFEDIQKYESNPDGYVCMEHDWFIQAEVQLKRSQTLKKFKLFSIYKPINLKRSERRFRPQ